MRRYAVTLAGSVRPGVPQSTVIEVEASTTPQARLQTQRSHPGSTVTKILAIAVPVRNPWDHRHSRLTYVFDPRMDRKAEAQPLPYIWWQRQARQAVVRWFAFTVLRFGALFSSLCLGTRSILTLQFGVLHQTLDRRSTKPSWLAMQPYFN